MPALPPSRPGCPAERRPRPLPDPAAERPPRPLPDPAAVRLCFIPDPAPPYDTENPGGGYKSRGQLFPEGALAGPPPAGRPPAGPASAGSLPVVPGPARTAGKPDTTPQGAYRVRPGDARAHPNAPDPGWTSRFAQVLAETLAGSRPPRQIEPWTTAQARSHIRRLAPYLASAQQPRVRRVLACQPSWDVVEVAAVVDFGAKVRALALRLERGIPPERGLLGAALPAAAKRAETSPAASGTAVPGSASGRPAFRYPAPAPRARGFTASGHAGEAAAWLCTAVEAA
jgi:hypothetical protein